MYRVQTESENKSSKMAKVQNYGENVSKLVGWVDRLKVDDLLSNLVAYQVAIHFNVLCTLMEDGIVGNVYNTLVIATNCYMFVVLYVEIME